MPRRHSGPRRGAFIAIGLLAVGALFLREARTSWLQARFVSAWASDIGYRVEPGADSLEWRAPEGPFDLRRGYARLPEIRRSLAEVGFEVEAQARVTPRFRQSVELGLYPVYPEKAQAGLTIADREGERLFEGLQPRRIYAGFDSIPEAVVATLLFIENRELMQEEHPNRNPAVEWDRLLRSLGGLLGRSLGADGSVAGGSTLATQLEKYRHSPGGLTASPSEKIRQMATATVRAYALGPETRDARRRIVVEYLNSVPLAGLVGHGEVLGLQDGLGIWFGLDPARANQLLREGGPRDSVGIAYRAALGLMLAQRRPSYYLATEAGREALSRRTDVYLGILADEGAIPRELAEAAGAARLEPRTVAPEADRVAFSDRKATNAIRARLLRTLGSERLYDIDRLDLTVRTTIDRAAQDSVTRVLRRLAEPAYVRTHGLDAPRLLGAGDPGRVVYSFILYEVGPEANELRVQTDNFEGPFDVNRSSRLELGSTAKLRTLVTYLEVVERLHGELAPLDPAARLAVADSLPDALTRWAASFLEARPEATLGELLDAGMERRYSASPAERFFTGGGSHVFRNFDNRFDGSVLTVREAFEQSVNLVFVRMMRDLERFHRARLPAVASGLLENPEHPQRREYLQRFADREGRQFVNRFFTKYEGKDAEGVLETLASGRRMPPRRLAWSYRSVMPGADETAFAAYLRAQSPDAELRDDVVADLWRITDPGAFGLADRGYLAGIHPLELGVARFRIERPDGTRGEALEASADARQEVYGWLFSPRRRAAQERSLSVMLEIEAFLEIQRAWRRLGYPFENVVPSYGSSIGSSGDRPAALAELVGILLNDGVRLPTVEIEELRFGMETPYETRWRYRAPVGEPVLSREVATVAREALGSVAERGTARSVANAFVDPQGRPVAVGGKTGTGNNQFRVFGAGGGLVGTRTINRTATFAFYLGDRHFGVVTAHVDGPEAAGYAFTSALPLAVLRLVAPGLTHLLQTPVIEDPGVEPAPDPRP